jgi:hypothetical protein
VDAKRRHNLRGEAIRDIGILLFVFVPLDIIVQHMLTSWWHWVLLFVVGCGFSLVLIELGVRMGADE